jgi:hypothetical protein
MAVHLIVTSPFAAAILACEQVHNVVKVAAPAANPGKEG